MTDDAHSVAHTAAVFWDGLEVGWIYRNRMGQSWFVGENEPQVTHETIARMWKIFGYPSSTPPSAPGSNSLEVMLSKPIDLSDLGDGFLKIVGCY